MSSGGQFVVSPDTWAANSQNLAIDTVTWPKATIGAGTTLSYKLSDIFDLPATNMGEQCAFSVNAHAVPLSGNPYSGTYAATADIPASAAAVTVTGAGNHARKTSAVGGAGPTGATGYGSASSTIAYSFSRPGTYLVGLSIGTIQSDTACKWGTVNNPVTGQPAAAETILEVISAADFAQPQTGWYWEPTQGGRGVAIEYYPSNSRIFLGIFGYAEGGQSSWLVGACTYVSSAKTCSGTLDSYRNGATINQKDGPIAQMIGSAGQFTLSFAQRDKPLLQWIGPPLALERYVLAGADTAPSTVTSGYPGGAALPTGWYWDPSLGGRGWFIETSRQPGGNLVSFSVGFMYREDGSPVWYMLESTAAAKAAPVLFEGANFREVAGGASMTAATWTAPNWSAVMDRGSASLAIDINSVALTFAAGRIPLSKFIVQ